MKFTLQPLIKRLKHAANLNNGVLVIALLVASTWAWSTVEAIQHNFTLQQQVDALAEHIEVEELQNKTLQLQKAYYNTDQYLELSARERLGLASPGEKLVALPANTVKPAPAVVAPTTDPAATRSNFAQWMYFLFGRKG
ncbi:MAG TPA: septum formation initiator family protein [Magnetospirillaceae bacterium]|nr:septum formation initiator family protein [Magnetospirillaceae bacterium]